MFKCGIIVAGVVRVFSHFPLLWSVTDYHDHGRRAKDGQYDAPKTTNTRPQDPRGQRPKGPKRLRPLGLRGRKAQRAKRLKRPKRAHDDDQHRNQQHHGEQGAKDDQHETMGPERPEASWAKGPKRPTHAESAGYTHRTLAMAPKAILKKPAAAQFLCL